MISVSLEPHYLPSIEYFAVLSQADKIVLDLEGRFRKQTYRNRATILGPNGVKTLSIPVHFKNNMKLKDVRIDYEQSWLRDHWGGIYSSYGKAPFFEHFANYFQRVYEKKNTFLVDLNMEMLSVCQDILQWQSVTITEKTKTDSLDLRDAILAKKSYRSRDILSPISYQQNFGNTFVPNLSILDLLYCEGPNASVIIKGSVKKPIERIVN